MRLKLLARDQYQRAVCAVSYGGILGLFQKDLSMELLKNGLATVYTSAGAEYNGYAVGTLKEIEAGAKQKGLGMWSQGTKSESPAEYKRRTMKAQGA